MLVTPDRTIGLCCIRGGQQARSKKVTVQSHLPQFRNESFEIAGWNRKQDFLAYLNADGFGNLLKALKAS